MKNSFNLLDCQGDICMIGVNCPVYTTHTLRRGPARDNSSSINKKMGRYRCLKCMRGCCYDRPHPTPVLVAMYSKKNSHLRRIRSTLLPTTSLLPSFRVFPDYRFVCLVWRVIIDFHCNSAFTVPPPKKKMETLCTYCTQAQHQILFHAPCSIWLKSFSS